MEAKGAFGAFAGIVFLLLGTTADAQLAKRGTYTSQFGWHATTKPLNLEEGHVFMMIEPVGINLNDAGSGFLHGAAVTCLGVRDIIKGASNAHGYCTAIDADGDKAFLVWKCAGQPGGRCEGDFQWTGGTGKYTGLKGNNSFHSGLVPNTNSGYSVWKGEWKLPD